MAESTSRPCNVACSSRDNTPLQPRDVGRERPRLMRGRRPCWCGNNQPSVSVSRRAFRRRHEVARRRWAGCSRNPGPSRGIRYSTAAAARSGARHAVSPFLGSTGPRGPRGVPGPGDGRRLRAAGAVRHPQAGTRAGGGPGSRVPVVPSWTRPPAVAKASARRGFSTVSLGPTGSV